MKFTSSVINVELKATNMIIIPTIIDKVTTLKDGSLKITLETSELPNEMMSQLFSLNNKQVYTAFKDTELKPDELDIKEMPLEFKNSKKSQSQRLKSVLFVYWQKHKPTQDFDTFYKRKTDEFINLIKDKID